VNGNIDAIATGDNERTIAHYAAFRGHFEVVE